MRSKKNILICPLDWGIGHASRCVPIIRKLLERDQNVIVGAAGRPMAFLQQEFPALKFINFPGYQIRYPAKNNMALKMLRSGPAILKGIRREHRKLKEIISENNIDLVISDNRFGAWSEDIPSVFITHQLRIDTGKNNFTSLFRPFLRMMNKSFIKNFDVCWIPDYAESPGLSGKLSHPLLQGINGNYIGPLSRFGYVAGKKEQLSERYDILVMISGPEPQRSIFENIILEQGRGINRKILILGGKPGEQARHPSGKHIDYRNHLETGELYQHLKNAELVISRPGYSTIMDLAYLQKKAVFVPTPGQTEQEYLAELHSGMGHCIAYRQDEFKLEHSIPAAQKLKGFTRTRQNTQLDHQIDRLCG